MALQKQTNFLAFTIFLTFLTTGFCISLQESVTAIHHHSHPSDSSSSSSSNNSVLYEIENEDGTGATSLPVSSPIVNERSSSDRRQDDNFILIDFLPDGEMERRISYNGIVAKETRAGNSR